ncbi:MAG: glycosyltransferase [Thaumarchaeota archaeon]|nr:glycosyltransferase [Nitrososphaerota archaeon]MDG6906102.1 glycosyltransferase [Nitrososphaerota archaeon]
MLQVDQQTLPLITIGIPTSNSAWSLTQVLDSILKLEYDKRRLRLVFPDNYSSDGTEKILTEFKTKHKDEFESIMVEQIRANIPVARNICIEKAVGTDYVFFLDSDVVVPSDTLTVLLKDFSSFDKVGIASFPADQENSKVRARSLFNGFYSTDGPMLAFKVGTSCTMISTAAFATVGQFNPKLYVHEDGEFCYRVRRCGFKIVSDYSRKGIHLKQVSWSAHHYLRFIWNSSNTYFEMLKLGSAMHALKVLTSILLVLFFILTVSLREIAPLIGFALTLGIAFWANGSRRVLDDGSKIRPGYYLIIPPVLTVLTMLVTGAVFVRIGQKIGSRFGRFGQN